MFSKRIISMLVVLSFISQALVVVDTDSYSSVVVEEEPEEEYDYVSMTKADLVELAKKRGLPVSGTKKKIIARLEEND